jgi:RNA polymerase-binding transcription factor DksA
MATEGAEDELVLRLMELRTDEIAEVEEAIERLGHGQYGVCEHCGKKIGAMRLRLVPAARYCVECQNGIERESAEANDMYDWSGVNEGGAEGRHQITSMSGSKF